MLNFTLSGKKLCTLSFITQYLHHFNGTLGTQILNVFIKKLSNLDMGRIQLQVQDRNIVIVW